MTTNPFHRRVERRNAGHTRAAAVMAYNLYFQPSYFKLLKYLSALGTRVENKVLFAVNCVSVFQQVKKRWQVLKTTGERG